MKIWGVGVMVILVISLLTLTACDLLGSKKKSQEEQYYEAQIEALKKQVEANQKAQQEYDEYYRQVQEAIKAQLEGKPVVTVTANQTGGQ